MAATNPKNRCQYWVEEVQCTHWNSGSKLCGYELIDEDDTLPSAYKTCNYVGSAVVCSHFDSAGAGPEFRCILPDPTRHIGNYKSSSKYAFYVGDPDDSTRLDTSLITGYSDDGTVCDGSGDSGGTNKTCSGYSPYQMGFGKILANIDTIEDDPKFSFKLPLNYSLLNLRATLSTCYWWNGPAHIFELKNLDDIETPTKNLTTEQGLETPFKFPEVSKPEGCTRSDTTDYVTHSYDNYPCNGCNNNCNHYTGICWQYAINDAIESGDKVLAEQILELRYYIKEEAWTSELYNHFGFKNIQINAYLNTDKYAPGLYVIYDIVNVDLVFGTGQLTFERSKGVLVEGTEVQQDDVSEPSNESNSINFPTLVKDIKRFLLAPLIINNFYDYQGKNVHETNEASKCTILIVGNQHTYTQDSLCINISKLKSKPSFFNYVEEHGDVNDLYVATINESGEVDNCASISKFHAIQEEFNYEIDRLRSEEPDCIFNNSLSKENKGFIFEVDAPYGENIILVLSKYGFQGDNFWGYSKIVVYTSYVSGFLSQSNYTISEGASSGSGSFVDRLYDYRRSLFGYEREIRFQFTPFTDKSLNYMSEATAVYNDYKSNDLLNPEITYSGNKLYRFRNNFNYIEFENLYPIGPGGYVLVEVEDTDNIVTNVYGKVEIKDDGDSDLYLELIDNEGGLLQCPMEIEKQGVPDGLQANQFIIRPKDMDKFKSVCAEGSRLYINEMLVPVRFNPENVPINFSSEWLLEPDPTDATHHVSSGSVDQAGNNYTVTNFNSSLVMAVGIKGVSGRLVNISKIKLAVWIKIPMSPDVEMSHSWTADFNYYKNYPLCTCCGPYSRVLVNSSSRKTFPPCGDHEKSPTSGVGKQWWPYVQCSSYSYYLKISNQIYGGVTTVKGLYKEGTGADRAHGSWDIRMEGPDENDYKTGLYCCFICPCSCQVTTYNYNRKGAAHFSGMCRYRGEVGEGTLKHWYETGGGLPRFGNTLRPQFNSYRSTDYVQYLYYDYRVGEYRTNWMWMPSSMGFSDIDYTNTEDQIYSEFCNSDVLPINALGTMLMTNMDGQGTSEYIGDARYRFTDVFEVYLEDAQLAYPKALHSNNNNPVLQYKAVGSGPIQWAWRDLKKDVERNYEAENELSPTSTFLGFLDIYLTPYKFDMDNMEHRLTCAEGIHEINFKAPTLDAGSGEYDVDAYPTLQLDDGLERCFTWQKTLDPEECQLDNDPGYLQLSNEPWLAQGLFDTDYVTDIEAAEEAETVLEESSQAGPIKRYYNRGVSFDFVGNINSNVVPVMFSTVTEFDCSPPFVDTLLMAGQSVDLEFSFTGIKKAISKGSITFKYGISADNNKSGDLSGYSINCVPAFKISADDNILFSSSCKIPTTIGVSEETVDFDYHVDIDYLIQRATTFNIVLDLTVPTDVNGDEIKPELDYTSTDENGVVRKIPFKFYTSVGGATDEGSAEFIKDVVSLFDTVLTDASEKIYVHERKYKVSFFSGNPTPPHGINVGQRVLSGRFDGKEYDTVWQRDKNGEVVNLPSSGGSVDYIHKTRSRSVFEAVEDAQYIHGDLPTMESAQEEVFNKVMTKDTYISSFTRSMYPDMAEFFDFHNLQRTAFTSTGSFNNNILYKIGTLKHYPKMQGKGFQLLPGLPWHERCRGNQRDGCNGDDVFYYAKKNMDDGTTETSSYDALDIFYKGTLMMLQRVSIAKFLINRMSSQYAAPTSGKVFEEGDPLSLSIPEFIPMPGLYDTTPEWYAPPKDRKWPYILPGLWQTFGKTDIFY